MTTDQLDPDRPTGEELTALSARARDVHVVVDEARMCRWSSADVPRTGAPVTDAFRAEDGVAVTGLFADDAQGPAVVRLSEEADGGRWVAAVSVPRRAGGWLLQLRDAHQLDPSTSVTTAAQDAEAGPVGRERALAEVGWLLSATPRTGREIAVASCGLDEFALLNDRLGPDAGDEVLRIVRRRISGALRSGDVVARLDGDQFLVVLRGVHHLRGAIRVANKIRAAVEDPIELSGAEIVQTVSVGVTLISRGESVDSVLERAEGAMAMAKDAGRNTVMSSPPI
jgi:diguanylate cyclase (GGDEF)-like protein